MNPERWQKVEEIFEGAADRPEAERAAFIEEACAGDAGLRAEVESLLRHRQPTGALISTLFLDAARLFGGGADDGARFVPGAVVAGRYRVVGPLGRGGMGEVWRADDLKLGQAVALKFLPEKLSRDAGMLERFHGEVRTARRVSHPNVCRVFDIGEAGGQHFLSMEYIDGEDLSSLLRRIGRLPEDKAVEVARQICAGLAAAHEEGVLHRDLKPANVMIDGRGRARLTDFGLAGLAEEFGGHEIRSGTPAYMSPEQLSGREVTARSDIYALGLLLYEVFTGRKAFAASTPGELVKMQTSSTPPSISSFVKDVDPIVERVIGRCLAPDPKDRPGTALQVAAALPGGDPLAAALAAGETPSPEMVAAAPREGALRPWAAALLLACVLGALGFLCFGTGELFLHRIAPFEKSPEVLADRARAVAARLGQTAPPADTDYGLELEEGYLDYLDERDRSPERWRRFARNQPGAYRFWYRQSLRPLEPRGDIRVTPLDPPPLVSGMVGVALDTEGRLLAFDAAPPQLEGGSGGAAQFDWEVLFEEAGLEMSAFAPAEPRWVPPHMSDARAAWEGRFPNAPDTPLRVEAAAYRGRPVYFELIAPWTRPLREEPWDLTPEQKRFYVIIFAAFMAVLAAAMGLARRNLRLGRGDRRGATRVASVVFVLSLLGWAAGADHVPSVAGEFYLFWFGIAKALIRAGVVWLLYVALEPYVRRRFPELIVSWSRLVAGDFRDPMVGRDVLVGLLSTLGGFALLSAHELVARGAGQPAHVEVPYLIYFVELREVALWLFDRQIFMSLLHGLNYVFVLCLIGLVLRRRWAAGLGLWLLLVVISLVGRGSPPSLTALVVSLMTCGVIAFVTARFGLLAMAAAQFGYFMSNFYLYTSDLSAWYAGSAVTALAVCAGLALYGFHTSLAGQPLLRGKFLDE
jgi:Protein kinase domain